jgi:hypothetical protein
VHRIIEMSNEQNVRFDMLKQPIDCGDIVTYVYRDSYGSSVGTLSLGRIIGFTPKNVKIEVPQSYRRHILRNASEVLVMKDEYVKRIMVEKLKGNIKSI